MQTFKASDSDNPKKPDYKPFLPEDVASDDGTATDSLEQPTSPVVSGTPISTDNQPDLTVSNPVASPEVSGNTMREEPILATNSIPARDGVAETFFYEPEHVYYPPTPQAFKAGHAGMDRRQFRSMIIGLLLLGLAGFILIIILFGKRGSQEYFAQQRNVADIVVSHPVYEQVVAPPFQIIGRARGYWYGETGQFPVQVFDRQDNPVAFGVAIAQTDIQNENDFVPFQAIVHDYQFWPSKKKGYITIQRPDVSPEMATIYTIPIEFKKQRGSYVVGSPIIDATASQNANNQNSQNTTTTTTTTNTGINNRSCANGQDDDGDGLFDVQDPECHFDFDAFNFNSYNPGGREMDPANIKPDPVEEVEPETQPQSPSTNPNQEGVWNQIDWVPQYLN